MTTDYIKYICEYAGRPSPDMSNERWQEIFELMRMATTPSNRRFIPIYSSKLIQNSHIEDVYCGDTLHQNRAKVLNDILKQIRKKSNDYVYFVYNIGELLKYERERLRSRYYQQGQYFEVWLDIN